MKNLIFKVRKENLDHFFRILNESNNESDLKNKIYETSPFKSFSFFYKTVKYFKSPIEWKTFLTISAHGCFSWFVALVLLFMGGFDLFFNHDFNSWMFAFSFLLIWTGRNIFLSCINFYCFIRPLKNMNLQSFKVYLIIENAKIEKGIISTEVVSNNFKKENNFKRKRL